MQFCNKYFIIVRYGQRVEVVWVGIMGQNIVTEELHNFYVK